MSQELENKLPKERWTNEPKPQQPNVSYLDTLLEETKSNVGNDLKLQDGESVELTFAPEDPDTGPRLQRVVEWDNQLNKPVVNVNGDRVYKEIPRFHFVIYNHKEKKQQSWWVSKSTAKDALLAMHPEDGFNTDTLLVKRTGKAKDTRYTFRPVGFKMAGG